MDKLIGLFSRFDRDETLRYHVCETDEVEVAIKKPANKKKMLDRIVESNQKKKEQVQAFMSRHKRKAESKIDTSLQFQQMCERLSGQMVVTFMNYSHHPYYREREREVISIMTRHANDMDRLHADLASDIPFAPTLAQTLGNITTNVVDLQAHRRTQLPNN